MLNNYKLRNGRRELENMVNLKWKRLGIIAGLCVSLGLAGCGQGEESNGEDEQSDGAQNVGEQSDYSITGIEPGAGITSATEDALSEYENLAGWELELSSTAGMLTTLGQAIENEEPIVITG